MGNQNKQEEVKKTLEKTAYTKIDETM